MEPKNQISALRHKLFAPRKLCVLAMTVVAVTVTQTLAQQNPPCPPVQYVCTVGHPDRPEVQASTTCPANTRCNHWAGYGGGGQPIVIVWCGPC